MSVGFKEPIVSQANNNNVISEFNTLMKKLPKFKLKPDAEGENHWFGFSVRADPARCFICYIHNETRLILFILTSLVLILLLGWIIADFGFHSVTAADLKENLYSKGLIVATVFTASAVFLSLVQIRQHRKNMLHPPSQRHLIWILGMVPVYAVSALLTIISLKTHGDFYLYTDFLRVVYEANVIYQFLILLTKYLGGHNGCVLFLLRKPPHKWPFPFGYCTNPYPSNSKFLWFLKYGCIQYTFVAPLVALIGLLAESLHVYGEGTLNPKYAYFWCALVMNFSQLWALYCLVWFYQVLAEELAPFQPMIKFLVVKLVVFFTFWQSIALSFGASLALINGGEGYSIGEVQVAINSILISVEMFIAAIAHRYAFSYEVYVDGSLETLMKDRADMARKEMEKDVAAFDQSLPYDFSFPTDTLGNPMETPGETSPKTGQVKLNSAEIYGSPIHEVPLVIPELQETVYHVAPSSQSGNKILFAPGNV